MSRLLAGLHASAATHPAAPALTGVSGTLSHAELWARVYELAEWLRGRQARVVALLADNHPDWVCLDLACLQAGCVFLPLPTFFTPGQWRHALADAGADLLVGGDEALARAAGARGQSDTVPGTNWPAWSLAVAPGALPPGTVKITYTSGSTGQPKGVCLSGDNQYLVASALAAAVDDPAPRHLCVLPLSTLLENIAGVYAPLLRGGEVVVPGLQGLGYRGSQPLDAQAFLAAVAAAAPRSLILVPQLLELLSAAASHGWLPPASLRFVAVGGSRVAASAILRARRLGIPVHEGYGLSECASVVSLNVPGCDKPGSAGRILPHLQLQVDADGGLHIRGNAFLGYAGQPDSWGRETVDTGDLGHLDADGQLCLDGRRKHLIISSLGRNISPEWVESEIMAHPGLHQCLLVGDARPACGLLVHAPDMDDAALSAWLTEVNASLPDYARVSRWVRLPEPFTAAAGLLTANGRPRRDLITQRHQALIDSLYPTAEEAIAS